MYSDMPFSLMLPQFGTVNHAWAGGADCTAVIHGAVTEPVPPGSVCCTQHSNRQGTELEAVNLCPTSGVRVQATPAHTSVCTPDLP